MKCPKCKERTEVLETAQRPDAPTRRRRRCLSPSCQHRFTTAESSLDSLVRHTGPGELELELKKITGKRRGYDPEALAAAISVDRRRKQMALEQRRRERYDDEDAPPRTLSRESLNRELGRY